MSTAESGDGFVLSVHERMPVCELSVRVMRADGVIVLEGVAWCYRFISERPAS